MRLGRALLFIGPALTAIHLISDSAGGDGTMLTYTVASAEGGIIVTIIGIALASRKPRRAGHEPQ